MSAALDTALDRYRAIRTQLREIFFELSTDPEQYCDRRDRVDSLDLERLTAATMLGELIGSTVRSHQRVVIVDLPEPIEEPSLAGCPTEPFEESRAGCPAAPFEEPSEVSSEPTREHETRASGEAEAAPASAEQVAAFRAEYDAAQVPIASAPTNTAPQGLAARRFAISLGRPNELLCDTDRLGEIELLEQATEAERLAALLSLTADSLKSVLEYLAARVRSAQTGIVGVPAWAARLDAVFRAVASLRAEHCSLYVYGLSRQHAPQHGTWLADAKALHDSLVVDASLETRSTTVPSTRSQSRPRDKAAETMATSASAQELPQTWPHWPLVDGKRAVMFGGAPSEPARLAIREAFRLGELEWIDGDKPRAVESLVERIRAGSVEVVFVNKFVSHNGTRQVLKAAKRAKFLAVVVRHGYGISAVREAIEHARGGVGVGVSKAA